MKYYYHRGLFVKVFLNYSFLQFFYFDHLPPFISAVALISLESYGPIGIGREDEIMVDSECAILAIQKMTMGELAGKYAALFGIKASTNNRKFIERKIAYQMQELSSGGIHSEIKSKIESLIRTYDPVNKAVGRTNSGKTESGRDLRLPMPGSFIMKTYKGKRLEVKVLENGFEYEKTVYKNLSAVAKAITGAHWNGFIFFGLKSHDKRQRN